ncbi:Uma2 family endonuclease [Streptomyces antarcticus]|uniref:Uma2 family endonuclease n=1 Tax=Streptomyces antarcticus TaxID=2996458 RepID=UPI00226F3F23|nr:MULTISPECIES: Uma2 family endonuclease [unclassified Streptomyces]MCY0947420.1 Uma2 family endonuclease [Streptomyces sp. H34-AA3]MCZ4086976.1 Uma2 family endonuclease [Streptomyces sp. H34-S5]
MTTAMAEPGRSAGGRAWEYLLQSWRELDVPEGWRAEIDGGRITLAPPPHRHHNGIAARVQRALYGVLPMEWEIYQTLGVHVASLGKLYVPDLVVAPSGLVEGVDADVSDPVDAAEVLLVVEITSKGNAEDDRKKKLWAYAHAPVPVYLLIDRFDEHGPTATLFTGPENGAYRHAERVAFGEALKLPDPFSVTLETEHFPH